MAKVKYYYDEDTLSYRKIAVKKSDYYRKILFSFLGVILIAFFGFIGFSQLITSPSELAQKRELENLKFHYELLEKRLEESSTILSQLQERDNNIYRVLFEANPIDEDIRKAGFGGINRYANLEGYENSDLVIETTKKIDILTKQLVIQSKSLDDIEKLVNDKQKMLAAIPSIQPVKNNDLTRIASGFGIRTDPFDKSRKMHKGMDFAAPRNTPVYAASNGKIVRADSRSIGYGKHIRIDHGYGFVTLYAHLNSYNVKRGQTVNKGDIIGFVGNTGRSKGLHLHYEVIKDGKSVNPVNYFYGNLTPNEFDEVLKISVQENQSLD